MVNFKEISEFIKANIMGCKFVGISSDNEVFVEFDHEDSDLESAAIKRIRDEFDYITKVTVVVRPSIEQIKQMVDGLNEVLDDKQPKKNLLDIGNF